MMKKMKLKSIIKKFYNEVRLTLNSSNYKQEYGMKYEINIHEQ